LPDLVLLIVEGFEFDCWYVAAVLVDPPTVEPGAESWRRDRFLDYVKAQSWLSRFTTVVDTTLISVGSVATTILENIQPANP
jgi:hypothetical protein